MVKAWFWPITLLLGRSQSIVSDADYSRGRGAYIDAGLLTGLLLECTDLVILCAEEFHYYYACV